jgi:FkbM family methyltransferase
MARGASRLLKIWLSEDRTPVALLAMQTKRAVKAVLPQRVLSALKPPYYRWLHRHTPPIYDETTDGVRALTRRGDFVVDIGANYGFYTRVLSEMVGEPGLVWAVEPMPETYMVLASVCRDFGNVEAFPYAMSDEIGAARMAIPQITYGESLYGARVIEGATDDRVVLVQRTTLDGLLLSQQRPPSLIKIDVEGHELQCLRGGHQALTRWHPALLIETLSDYTPGASVTDFLKPYGYKPYNWSGQFVPQSGPYRQDTFYIAG